MGVSPDDGGGCVGFCFWNCALMCLLLRYMIVPTLSSASMIAGIVVSLYMPISGAMLGNDTPVTVRRDAMVLSGWSGIRTPGCPVAISWFAHA